MRFFSFRLSLWSKIQTTTHKFQIALRDDKWMDGWMEENDDIDKRMNRNDNSRPIGYHFFYDYYNYNLYEYCWWKWEWNNIFEA